MDSDPYVFAPIPVASISGGNFPYQLRMLQMLMECGFKYPHIAMGSSGGNVSLFLAMAARWTPQGLQRVASELTEKFFIEPWFPYLTDIAPDQLIEAAGYFKGSLFKSSSRSNQLFKSYFAPGDITDTEMWVGAVREDTGSIGLFCNKCRNHSIIKGDHYNRRMFKSEPLQWLCGDLDMICKASVASSSIPAVVEGQIINGKKYVDGGVKFASPLTPLQSEVREVAKKQGHRIHLIYLSGYNVEADIAITPLQTMLDHGRVTGSHVVRAFVLHDRMAALEIVKDISASCQNVCRDDHHKLNYVDIEARAIPEVYKRLHLTGSCLLELYPLSTEVLTITKFVGCDVIRMMNSAVIGGHLWWSGNPHLFDGINGVIATIFDK